MAVHRIIRLASLAFCASLAACGPHRAGRPLEIIQTKPGEQVITEEAILESGASTAWEVIRRAAPNIQVRETKNGEPARMWRRAVGGSMPKSVPDALIEAARGQREREHDRDEPDRGRARERGDHENAWVAPKARGPARVL